MEHTRHKVNIIGHQNPDTDSICSAIAYAWLKNKLGGATFEARRAGNLNRETAFVLKYFGVRAPRLCTDVSPQIKDIDIRRQPGIAPRQACTKPGNRCATPRSTRCAWWMSTTNCWG